jgi:hypothetical protein
VEVNHWALKSWDNKISLQWNLLKDLISPESLATSDAIVDAWFSIIFSSSHPLTSDCLPSTFLSTLCSGFLDWHSESYMKEMITTISKELTTVTNWQYLEYLYLPVLVPMDPIDHWILLRVRVGSLESVIEVYDSLGNTLSADQMQVCFILQINHSYANNIQRTQRFLQSLQNCSIQESLQQDSDKPPISSTYPKLKWKWQKSQVYASHC